jgi:hypothetical protein
MLCSWSSTTIKLPGEVDGIVRLTRTPFSSVSPATRWICVGIIIQELTPLNRIMLQGLSGWRFGFI